MKRNTLPILLLFALTCLSGALPNPPGIYFHFKKRDFALLHPMRQGDKNFLPRGNFSNKKLDTLSNWFSPEKQYVEIVRQDNPTQPTIGMALGFEFDEKNGEYPYTPAHAVLQLKNFGWGGVEFSPRDTLNYTGISNAVSDDLTIEILDFQNDTITGRFFGLLLSGAGPMTSIDSGYFRVRVYRVR